MSEYSKKQLAFMASHEDALEEGWRFVIGWSDEANGWDWSEYIDWMKDQFDDLTEGDDLPATSYADWLRHKREADDDELGFSHACCEICGALPGDRYKVSAVKLGHELIEYGACSGCLQYIANSVVPDDENL